MANIVDVVGDYVSLRRSGANYKGLCPFHNERTPSFMVSTAKNYCHCFGCGRGGDPIGFLKELNNFTYREALMHLANKYHIEVKEVEVSDEEVAERQKRQAYLTLCEFICNFYKEQLTVSNEGMQYLNRLGLNDAIIKRFNIGYAPSDGTSLTNAINSAGFSISHANDLGFVAPMNGGMSDIITNSIILPIYSKTGKVVAFAYQSIDNENATFENLTAKSSIFNPKDSIFGLFQASHKISREKACYFVPTPYDVLMMHQSGFENAISPSHDVLDNYIVNDLSKLIRDEAVTIITSSTDKKITSRSIAQMDSIIPKGINVFFFDIAPKNSLGEMLQSTNASALQDNIDKQKTDCISFKANTLINFAGDNNNEKIRAIINTLRTIALMPDQSSRQIYLNVLASVTSVSYDILDKELKKIKPY